MLLQKCLNYNHLSKTGIRIGEFTLKSNEEQSKGVFFHYLVHSFAQL